MSRLKSETFTEHQRLEDHVDILHNLNSIDQYRRLLIKHAGFMVPLHCALARHDWNSIGLDFPSRSRLPALNRDMACLDIHTVEPITAWPALNNFAHAVGTFYVLEGSTLGGMIIAKQLKVRLGIDETNGGAFFFGRGKETATMWREFGAAAERFVEVNGKGDDVIDGAKKTFAELAKWFER